MRNDDLPAETPRSAVPDHLAGSVAELWGTRESLAVMFATEYGYKLRANQLSSMLTDVLSRDEWLVAVDHLVTHADEPSLLLLLVVAYLCENRGAIMAAGSADEVDRILTRHNPVVMDVLPQKSNLALARHCRLCARRHYLRKN